MEDSLPAIASVATQYATINERFERQMIAELINGLTNGYFDNINDRRGWELSLFETVHKAHSDSDYSPNVDTHTTILLQRQMDKNGFVTPESSRRTRSELLYGAHAYVKFNQKIERYSPHDRMLMNMQGSLDFDSEMDQMLGEKITISSTTAEDKEMKMKMTDGRFQDYIGTIGKTEYYVSRIPSSILFARLAEITYYSRGNINCIVVRTCKGNVMQFLGVSWREIQGKDRICLDDLISHMSQAASSALPIVRTTDDEYIQIESTNVIQLEHLIKYNKGEPLEQYIINAIENIETREITYGNDGGSPFDTLFKVYYSEGKANRISWQTLGVKRLLEYVLLKNKKINRNTFGPYCFNKENAHEKIKQTYGIYKGMLTLTNKKRDLTVDDILKNEIELKYALQLYLDNKKCYCDGKHITNTDQIKTIQELIDIIGKITDQVRNTISIKPNAQEAKFSYNTLSTIHIAPFMSKIYDALTNGGQWRPASRITIEEEFGDSMRIWGEHKHLFVRLAPNNKESMGIEYYRKTVSQAIAQKKDYAEFIDEKIDKLGETVSTEYHILKAIQLALSTFAPAPSFTIIRDKTGQIIGGTETEKFYHVLFELVRAEKQLKAINDNTTPWNKFELWVGMALVNTWEALREIGANAQFNVKLSTITKILNEFQKMGETKDNAFFNARWITYWVDTEDFLKQWSRLQRK